MILGVQRRRVAKLAAEVARDRARAAAGWDQFVGLAQRRLGTPTGLIGSFVAGLVAERLLHAAARASGQGIGIRSLAVAAVWGYQTFMKDAKTLEGTGDACDERR